MRYTNIMRKQLVYSLKFTFILFSVFIFFNTAAMALSIPPMSLPPLKGTPNGTTYTDTGGGTKTLTEYDENGIREESATFDSNGKIIATTYYEGNGDPITREHFDPKTGMMISIKTGVSQELVLMEIESI